MSPDELEAEFRARIAAFKEMTEQTLAIVRRVKEQAREAGLVGIYADLYRVASRREQELTETLKAMEADPI